MSGHIAPSPALLDFARAKLSVRLRTTQGDKSEPLLRSMLDEKMKKLGEMDQGSLGTMLLSELPSSDFIIC